MPTHTNHRFRRTQMPMNRHHSPRLQSIEHPLRAIGRRIPQIQIHPQPRRSLSLSAKLVQNLFVNDHIKFYGPIQTKEASGSLPASLSFPHLSLFISANVIFTHHTSQQSPSSPQSAKVLQDEQHDGSGNPDNTHAPRHQRSTAASVPSPQDWMPLAPA